jgi:hypothetical protein
MHRILATLAAPALAALIAAPAFAEATPQPQSIPIQITPPKANVTVRTITLDTAGAVTPEGQKVLDEMIEEGWRAVSMSTVSSNQPVTLAVMFSRTARPPMPQGQPPQGQLPQGQPLPPPGQVHQAPPQIVQPPRPTGPPPPSDHNP